MTTPSSLTGICRCASPYLLSALRIVCGLLLLNFGTMKILGFPAGMSPPVGSLSWVAGMLELCLGFLVAIGLFTRPAAFVLSGLMAAAYFIGHFPKSFFPSLNGGMAAAALCFVFLYVAAAGAGPISIDALRDRGRTER